MQYILIKGYTEHVIKFQNEINSLLQDGWELYGFTFVCGMTLYQALVKRL